MDIIDRIVGKMDDLGEISNGMDELAHTMNEENTEGQKIIDELKASQERNIGAINSIVGEIDKLTKRMDEIKKRRTGIPQCTRAAHSLSRGVSVHR